LLILLIAKQTRVCAEKTRGGRHKSVKVTQKIHEKNEMLPLTFAGCLYKTQERI